MSRIADAGDDRLKGEVKRWLSNWDSVYDSPEVAVTDLTELVAQWASEWQQDEEDYLKGKAGPQI